MPFNGTGTFDSLPAPTFPPISGNVISSAYFIANMDDVFTGLSNCVTRDGQSPATNNLPMGGHKLTGLEAGTVSGDSARYDELAAETTRAEGAEATLTTNLAGEVINRQNGDVAAVNAAEAFTTAALANYFQTGDTKFSLSAAAMSGWVIANDGTIGSAASGATTRANADCQALFTLLWGINAITAGFAPVTGGVGASAAADWAANKKIQLGPLSGRVLGATGAGAGLTARTIGQNIGAETYMQQASDLASHAHLNGVANGSGRVQVYNASTSGIPGNSTYGCDETFAANVYQGTTSVIPTVSQTAMPIVQPTTFLNLFIKL
jgi:hypothetical protein